MYVCSYLNTFLDLKLNTFSHSLLISLQHLLLAHKSQTTETPIKMFSFKLSLEGRINLLNMTADT